LTKESLTFGSLCRESKSIGTLIREVVTALELKGIHKFVIKSLIVRIRKLYVSISAKCIGVSLRIVTLNLIRIKEIRGVPSSFFKSEYQDKGDDYCKCCNAETPKDVLLFSAGNLLV
jgi:hypothetical protein